MLLTWTMQKQHHIIKQVVEYWLSQLAGNEFWSFFKIRLLFCKIQIFFKRQEKWKQGFEKGESFTIYYPINKIATDKSVTLKRQQSSSVSNQRKLPCKKERHALGVKKCDSQAHISQKGQSWEWELVLVRFKWTVWNPSNKVYFQIKITEDKPCCNSESQITPEAAFNHCWITAKTSTRYLLSVIPNLQLPLLIQKLKRNMFKSFIWWVWLNFT